jgi:hypothetical protein
MAPYCTCIMYKSSFEQHTCLLNNQLFWRFHCRILEYSKNVEFWNFQHFSTNNIISVEAAKVLPGIRLKIICWKFRGEFWKQVLRILQKYCLAVFFPCVLFGPPFVSFSKQMDDAKTHFGLMLCSFGACYRLIKGKHRPNRIKACITWPKMCSNRPKVCLGSTKMCLGTTRHIFEWANKQTGKERSRQCFCIVELVGVM